MKNTTPDISKTIQTNHIRLYMWRFGIKSIHDERNVLYTQNVIAATEAEARKGFGEGYYCLFAGRRPLTQFQETP